VARLQKPSQWDAAVNPFIHIHSQQVIETFLTTRMPADIHAEAAKAGILDSPEPTAIDCITYTTSQSSSHEV
jgi:hypothetical protein